MEKILFKRIGLMFIILLIIITAIFSCYIYSVESMKFKQDVVSKLDQIYAASLSSDKMTLEVDESYEEDYLNRAYAIDYMLTNDENVGVNDLTYIKSLMELHAIHLIKKDGSVYASSEKEGLHDNIFNYQDGEKFKKILSGKSETFVVLWENIAILKDDPLLYVAIPSTNKNYQMVLIGISSSVLENLRYFASIHYMLITTPDTEGSGYFVVSEDSGNILGSTLNNYQSIEIEGANSRADFVNILKSCTNGKVVNLNGKARYLRVLEKDARLFCGFYDGDNFWAQVVQEILYVAIGICTVFLCIMIMLRIMIKKIVINDLRGIETGIRQLIQGNYDVQFKASYPTEFQDISSVMNDWKDTYKYKSNRMTRITTAISEHIGTFECLKKISQNFFSDNIQEILNLNDYEWKKISSTPESFEQFIISLQKYHMKEEGIVHWKGRYLKISSFHRHGEFYGMLMDCSKDIEEQHRMQLELANVTKESLTDSLTKLANRKKLEFIVQQALHMNNPTGMMFIIDLDNFKQVNDAEGHPEGDKVLILFAQILLNFFRKNDLVARIGGDEFIVFIDNLMPDQVLKQKMDMLFDKIHTELKRYCETYGLSASIGIAYIDHRIRSFEELYKCADKALYQAKRNGKNCYYVNVENKRCVDGNCIICTGKCKRKDLE